jgi:hypothetical protein
VRFKALVTTILFAAGVAASVAVAKGPPPGKGKDKNRSATTSTTGSTSTSTAPCRPKIAVILKGEFVSASGSEDEGVFQMKVRQANRHGKRFVAETVTIRYDEKTTFRRRGHAEADDFEAGDRLNVQARACKEQKAKKPKKPKPGSTTASTSTATTTAATGTTSTGTSPATAELLARRVTGSPAKQPATTTGTTTTTSTGP